MQKKKKLVINLPEIKEDLKTIPHKVYGDNSYVSILSYVPYGNANKSILNTSIIWGNNFKISKNGNCIYLAQKDKSTGALYISKLDLLTRENPTLLKISSEENADLSWTSFDIIDDIIVYAFSSQKDDIHDPAFYKSKLYVVNISEDSLTNIQLLYGTPNGEATSLWFKLSDNAINFSLPHILS